MKPGDPRSPFSPQAPALVVGRWSGTSPGWRSSVWWHHAFMVSEAGYDRWTNAIEKMGAIPLWDFTRHWLHVLLSTLQFFFGLSVMYPEILWVFERFPKRLTTHDHSKQRWPLRTENLVHWNTFNLISLRQFDAQSIWAYRICMNLYEFVVWGLETEPADDQGACGCAGAKKRFQSSWQLQWCCNMDSRDRNMMMSKYVQIIKAVQLVWPFGSISQLHINYTHTY